MKQANSDFLEQHKDCYTEVVNAQTATKANKIKQDLFRIMKEEFLPGYSYTDDCGSCLFDMVNLLYRYYNGWKAKQPSVPVVEYIEPLKPEILEPQIVKGTFPSHKKNIRR